MNIVARTDYHDYIRPSESETFSVIERINSIVKQNDNLINIKTLTH